MVFTAVLVATALASTALGEIQEPLRIRCQWTRPTTGSPVAIYQLQIVDVNGGLDTTYVVPAQAGEVQEYIFADGDYMREYRARVRGIDADGDEGPWSPWSPLVAYEVEDPEP
jgi:hypothetical protein